MERVGPQPAARKCLRGEKVYPSHQKSVKPLMHLTLHVCLTQTYYFQVLKNSMKLIKRKLVLKINIGIKDLSIKKKKLQDSVL